MENQNTPASISRQYGPPLWVTGILFISLSLYLFFRRGYFDLYISNKIYAGVAAILLGMVLLLGPLGRLFSFADNYVHYRKELGIIAFILAVIHGVVSLFFLPARFPLSSYIGALNWPFIFGLVATVFLIAIFFISNEKAMLMIGGKTWWRIQNWGIRIAFILVMLHVFIMKWGSWIKWYRAGGSAELVHPEWPGAGLLVGWFMAFVLFIRLIESFGKTPGRLAWYFSAFALPLVYILTFIRGGLIFS